VGLRVAHVGLRVTGIQLYAWHPEGMESASDDEDVDLAPGGGLCNGDPYIGGRTGNSEQDGGDSETVSLLQEDSPQTL